MPGVSRSCDPADGDELVENQVAARLLPYRSASQDVEEGEIEVLYRSRNWDLPAGTHCVPILCADELRAAGLLTVGSQSWFGGVQNPLLEPTGCSCCKDAAELLSEEEDNTPRLLGPGNVAAKEQAADFGRRTRACRSGVEDMLLLGMLLLGMLLLDLLPSATAALRARVLFS